MIEQHTEYYDVCGQYTFNCMNNSITDHANRGWFVKTMINFPEFGVTNSRILIVYEREIAENKKKEIKISIK